MLLQARRNGLVRAANALDELRIILTEGMSATFRSINEVAASAPEETSA